MQYMRCRDHKAVARHMGSTRSVPAVKAYFTKQKKRLGLNKLLGVPADVAVTQRPHESAPPAPAPASPTKVSRLRS